ncbi:secretin N-terminal domain-containing protein [Phenylobacterium sp.]|uniref:secretin N-terminal domain-containing protein n=1 Tax=Phenylobacterium sp. TaxID=1871053 RepID=UPI0035B44E70
MTSLLALDNGATVEIDPRVGGAVTFLPGGQISPRELPALLRDALRAVHLDLAGTTHGFRLTPVESGAAVGQPAQDIAIVGLGHAGADQVIALIAPLLRGHAAIWRPAGASVVILAGHPDAVTRLAETVKTLDAEWLQGMALSIIPVDGQDPDAVVARLRQAHGAQAGPIGLEVEAVSLKSAEAVLAVSRDPLMLDRVRLWIAQQPPPPPPDLGRIRVIPLLNADAVGLAETVRKLIRTTPVYTQSSQAQITPIQPTPPPYGTPYYPPPAPVAQVQINQAQAATAAEVTADATHNALIVRADSATFADIRAMVEALDAPVDQVAIEATIAEVTLNNDFRFGVQWNFDAGRNSFTLAETGSGQPSALFPGFSWANIGPSALSTLNSLASRTNVEVISSPIIVTLNNKEASLQIGNQVPIITQSTANVTTPNASVVNSVQYRDTGITLKVTPRIGAGETVTLEIAQEASQVAATTTSGIDSPTIQQRSFRSTVSIVNGQTVALGGLISADRTRSKAGVPVVSAIPVLGELFGHRATSVHRTELIVFLTPRILRGEGDTVAISEELKGRLDSLRASDFIQARTPGK